MANVTPELIYEVLKAMQERLAQVDGKVDEVKQELQALRVAQVAQNGFRQDVIGLHHEIAGIHATLVRHEARLDRIERRLEISDIPVLP